MVTSHCATLSVMLNNNLEFATSLFIRDLQCTQFCGCSYVKKPLNCGHLTLYCPR